MGDVSRWHANADDRLRLSGDTITAHEIRCVLLLNQLHPNPSNRLREIVRHHDEAERIVGDMPYPAKVRFSALRVAYAAAEAIVMQEMGHPVPETLTERQWLKLVDRLDAQMWMTRYAPELAATDEWQDSAREIAVLADALGVGAAVGEIATEAKQ